MDTIHTIFIVKEVLEGKAKTKILNMNDITGMMLSVKTSTFKVPKTALTRYIAALLNPTHRGKVHQFRQKMFQIDMKK